MNAPVSGIHSRSNAIDQSSPVLRIAHSAGSDTVTLPKTARWDAPAESASPRDDFLTNLDGAGSSAVFEHAAMCELTWKVVML